MSAIPTGEALSFAAKAGELAGELYDKAYRRGRASADADLSAAAVLIAELLVTDPDPTAHAAARIQARGWLREYAARSVR